MYFVDVALDESIAIQKLLLCHMRDYLKRKILNKLLKISFNFFNMDIDRRRQFSEPSFVRQFKYRVLVLCFNLLDKVCVRCVRVEV